MEKRRTERLVDSMDAEIISEGIRYPGIVMNFSEEGLYMVTATANMSVNISPSSILKMKCMLPTGDQVNVDCEVKWLQTRTSPYGVTFSLGMELLDPPKEYKKFISSLR